MFDKIKLNEFMEGELSFYVCKFFAIIESLFLGCLFRTRLSKSKKKTRTFLL